MNVVLSEKDAENFRKLLNSSDLNLTDDNISISSIISDITNEKDPFQGYLPHSIDSLNQQQDENSDLSEIFFHDDQPSIEGEEHSFEELSKADSLKSESSVPTNNLSSHPPVNGISSFHFQENFNLADLDLDSYKFPQVDKFIEPPLDDISLLSKDSNIVADFNSLLIEQYGRGSNYVQLSRLEQIESFNSLPYLNVSDYSENLSSPPNYMKPFERNVDAIENNNQNNCSMKIQNNLSLQSDEFKSQSSPDIELLDDDVNYHFGGHFSSKSQSEYRNESNMEFPADCEYLGDDFHKLDDKNYLSEEDEFFGDLLNLDEKLVSQSSGIFDHALSRIQTTVVQDFSSQGLEEALIKIPLTEPKLRADYRSKSPIIKSFHDYTYYSQQSQVKVDFRLVQKRIRKESITLFRICDLNKDGYLNYEEFCLFLRKAGFSRTEKSNIREKINHFKRCETDFKHKAFILSEAFGTLFANSPGTKQLKLEKKDLLHFELIDGVSLEGIVLFLESIYGLETVNCSFMSSTLQYFREMRKTLRKNIDVVKRNTLATIKPQQPKANQLLRIAEKHYEDCNEESRREYRHQRWVSVVAEVIEKENLELTFHPTIPAKSREIFSNLNDDNSSISSDDDLPGNQAASNIKKKRRPNAKSSIQQELDLNCTFAPRIPPNPFVSERTMNKIVRNVVESKKPPPPLAVSLKPAVPQAKHSEPEHLSVNQENSYINSPTVQAISLEEARIRDINLVQLITDASIYYYNTEACPRGPSDDEPTSPNIPPAPPLPAWAWTGLAMAKVAGGKPKFQRQEKKVDENAKKAQPQSWQSVLSELSGRIGNKSLQLKKVKKKKVKKMSISSKRLHGFTDLIDELSFTLAKLKKQRASDEFAEEGEKVDEEEDDDSGSEENVPEPQRDKAKSVLPKVTLNFPPMKAIPEEPATEIAGPKQVKLDPSPLKVAVVANLSKIPQAPPLPGMPLVALNAGSISQQSQKVTPTNSLPPPVYVSEGEATIFRPTGYYLPAPSDIIVDPFSVYNVGKVGQNLEVDFQIKSLIFSKNKEPVKLSTKLTRRLMHARSLKHSDSLLSVKAADLVHSATVVNDDLYVVSEGNKDSDDDTDSVVSKLLRGKFAIADLPVPKKYHETVDRLRKNQQLHHETLKHKNWEGRLREADYSNNRTNQQPTIVKEFNLSKASSQKEGTLFKTSIVDDDNQPLLKQIPNADKIFSCKHPQSAQIRVETALWASNLRNYSENSLNYITEVNFPSTVVGFTKGGQIRCYPPIPRSNSKAPTLLTGRRAAQKAKLEEDRKLEKQKIVKEVNMKEQSRRRNLHNHAVKTFSLVRKQQVYDCEIKSRVNRVMKLLTKHNIESGTSLLKRLNYSQQEYYHHHHHHFQGREIKQLNEEANYFSDEGEEVNKVTGDIFNSDFLSQGYSESPSNYDFTPTFQKVPSIDRSVIPATRCASRNRILEFEERQKRAKDSLSQNTVNIEGKSSPFEKSSVHQAKTKNSPLSKKWNSTVRTGKEVAGVRVKTKYHTPYKKSSLKLNSTTVTSNEPFPHCVDFPLHRGDLDHQNGGGSERLSEVSSISENWGELEHVDRPLCDVNEEPVLTIPFPCEMENEAQTENLCIGDNYHKSFPTGSDLHPRQIETDNSNEIPLTHPKSASVANTRNSEVNQHIESSPIFNEGSRNVINYKVDDINLSVFYCSSANPNQIEHALPQQITRRNSQKSNPVSDFTPILHDPKNNKIVSGQVQLHNEYQEPSLGASSNKDVSNEMVPESLNFESQFIKIENTKETLKRIKNQKQDSLLSELFNGGMAAKLRSRQQVSNEAAANIMSCVDDDKSASQPRQSLLLRKSTYEFSCDVDLQELKSMNEKPSTNDMKPSTSVHRRRSTVNVSSADAFTGNRRRSTTNISLEKKGDHQQFNFYSVNRQRLGSRRYSDILLGSQKNSYIASNGAHVVNFLTEGNPSDLENNDNLSNYAYTDLYGHSKHYYDNNVRMSAYLPKLQ